MDDIPPLEAEIRRRIQAAGPMPVGEFMTLCLTDRAHGYYTTRDPLGERGDFITSPEISQMFGELIGLWMAAVWKRMGEPPNLRVIELGPGRGTMINDALRAAKVMPAFRDAVVLHLVEISPVLQAQQEKMLEQLPLPMYWHPALRDVPGGPCIIVANEFFDALPVNQAVKAADGWHERVVEIDAAGNLAFTVAAEPIAHFERLLPQQLRRAAEGSIFEWRTDTVAMEIGRRLKDGGGAALVIDYGHAQSAAGETLQAVGRHAYVDPLTAPGSIDLTAHVDFERLAKAVEAMGAASYGPVEQSEFLRRLGIATRAAALKAKAAPAAAAAIDTALARLTGHGRTGMGTLFKAAAYAHPQLGRPPGFE
ncbi:MAG TPA: SAM-dependent methyltransferase [Pseudolabrys sp.]|nr:SAM-dependent methyltransferase [Pseudolabrys sp.]